MNVLCNLFSTFLMLTLPFYCMDPLLPFKLLKKFDFIIVGAGTAGSVLANRLTENPNINVLLIEAGGCPPIPSPVPAYAPIMHGTNVDWGLKIAPQTNSFLSYKNHQANFPQGKMLGGGSGINDMMYIRGNSWDYDNWESLGNPGWGYNDVLPYFKIAEGNTISDQMNDAAYHSTTGPVIVSLSPYNTPSLQNFILSGQRNGYKAVDVNGPSQTGVTPIPFTMSNGARWSTFDAYLQPAMRRSNLVTVTGAYVIKVLLVNNQATGVQYVVNNQINTAYATREVILSAGALESPKILMQSGIGDPAELRQFNIPVLVNLPGVGKNLMDHVGCGALMWKVNCTDCTYSIQGAMSLWNIFQWALFRQGPICLAFANEGVAFVNTKYANQSGLQPDVELQYVSADSQNALGDLEAVTNIDSTIAGAYYQVFEKQSTFSIYPFNIKPKSRGTVSLQSSDPTQPPIFDFNYFGDAQDMKVLIEGVKVAFAFGNSSAFESLGAQYIPTVYPGCQNFTQFTDSYWECVIRQFTLSVYHAAGSCKMGNLSDPMAVVNAQLQVYGTIGLRVADGSIMPHVPAGNPAAAINMIGEKASAMIKQFYNI